MTAQQQETPGSQRLRTGELSSGLEVGDVLALLTPVVYLLDSLVGEHLEVVLHDLSHPSSSVRVIANGHVSGRSSGDPILSGPRDDAGFRELHQDAKGTGHISWTLIDGYKTKSASGQQLRSATLLFRDGDGSPAAALCLNADMAVFEMAYGWLEQLLHREQPRKENSSPPKDVDMTAMMEEIIQDAVRRFRKRPDLMNKEERMSAVEVMMQRGLFMIRNSVSRAASALGVSRFTIYNYIDQIKQRDKS